MVQDIDMESGVGAPQENGVKLGDEISCAICTDIYEEPKLLHCMHTFCGGCIGKLTKTEDNQERVVCPICRFVTKVGSGGSSKLWRNHIIEQKVKWNKVEMMRENNKFDCCECESEVATKLCNDCSMKLCDSCAAHHKRCARFKEHSVESIDAVSNEELFEEEAELCSEHGLKLEVFCETCKVSVCSDCMLSVSHRCHAFLSVDEVMDKELKALDTLLVDSEQCCKLYEDYFNELDEFHKKATEKRDASKKHIEDSFSELIQLLQNEKQKLFNWLDKEFESSVDTLNFAKKKARHVKSMASYLREVSRHPKEKIFDILKDGVSLLKSEIGSMKAANRFSVASPDSSLQEETHVTIGDNEFDIVFRARRIEASEMFASVKSSIKQIGLLPHEKVSDPSLVRLGDGFRFIKSVFPAPAGTVKFKVRNISKINGEIQSQPVAIGNFMWRIRVLKKNHKKLMDDEHAGWYVQCRRGDGNGISGKCCAVLKLVLKCLKGGNDYRISNHTIEFHANSSLDSYGHTFKRAGFTWQSFVDKGFIKDGGMEIHALIKIVSWEDDSP